MSSAQGIMALDSPYTGIVDWRMVALRYGKDFEEVGGSVVTEYDVKDISMVKESPAGSTEGKNTFCRFTCQLTTHLWLKKKTQLKPVFI